MRALIRGVRLKGLAAWLCLAVLAASCVFAAQAAVPPYDQAERAILAAIAAGKVKKLHWRVVSRSPHDPEAFTQGLVFVPGENGRRPVMIESLGRYGLSEVRVVHPASGRPTARKAMPATVFLEGLTLHDGKAYALTWKERTGFILSWPDLTLLGRFDQPFEGWGLTSDGERLIASDGSQFLRLLAPPKPGETVREAGRLTVTANGAPVIGLNELEYVEQAGKPARIYANVFTTELIIAIDAATGAVLAALDLSGLRAALTEKQRAEADALNGVAHDPATGRLFVTGKLWPTVFEIETTEKAN